MTTKRTPRASASGVGRTNSARTSSRRANGAAKASGRKGAAIRFEVDPELLNPEYNQARRPRLPYGIVINDKPAGILIPVDQLESGGWLELPEPDALDQVTIGGNEVDGVLLRECRMVVLQHIPPYIRYKDADQLVERGADPALGQTFVGPYEEYRAQLDKGLMEVCSEHALVFLSEDNDPLHTVPFIVRFKNVALWSLISTYEDYYRKLERAFAEYTNQPFASKSDRWRSLGVLPLRFEAEKEGQGRNKSWCCKVEATVTPSAETLPELFLGTPQGKGLVWGLQEEVAGFVESSALTLPAAEPVKALPGVVQATPADLALGDEDDDYGDDDDDAEIIDVEAVHTLAEEDIEGEEEEDFGEDEDDDF
ncbi:DUF5895 domain-containing protein [Leptolyngbya sp. PCC 6406]|uniref:DUF5895 domain-containing protein n=1 Tax=Leptolyngbya sp. PCC 6406 TaxID=1173264 RepID=UPI0002AC74F1|nr:DUF5895 domain-containing protein [Leptolyngbya sp. PCC 6406]